MTTLLDETRNMVLVTDEDAPASPIDQCGDADEFKALHRLRVLYPEARTVEIHKRLTGYRDGWASQDWSATAWIGASHLTGRGRTVGAAVDAVVALMEGWAG